ncbi:hypothetical protein PGB90_000885 [Kerria lacca]
MPVRKYEAERCTSLSFPRRSPENLNNSRENCTSQRTYWDNNDNTKAKISESKVFLTRHLNSSNVGDENIQKSITSDRAGTHNIRRIKNVNAILIETEMCTSQRKCLGTKTSTKFYRPQIESVFFESFTGNQCPLDCTSFTGFAGNKCPDCTPFTSSTGNKCPNCTPFAYSEPTKNADYAERKEDTTETLKNISNQISCPKCTTAPLTNVDIISQTRNQLASCNLRNMCSSKNKNTETIEKVVKVSRSTMKENLGTNVKIEKKKLRKTGENKLVKQRAPLFAQKHNRNKQQPFKEPFSFAPSRKMKKTADIPVRATKTSKMRKEFKSNCGRRPAPSPPRRTVNYRKVPKTAVKLTRGVNLRRDVNIEKIKRIKRNEDKRPPFR